MPITVRCPHCGRQFNLSDSLFGKKVRCKNCQEAFTVSAPPAPRPADVKPEEEERRLPNRGRRDDWYKDDEPPPPPKAPPIPTKWLVLGGAVGGGAFLFIGLLIAAISSLQSQEQKLNTTPTAAPPQVLNLAPAPAPVEPPPVAAPVQPRYGPNETVTVNVLEIPDDATRRQIEQRLQQLADAPQAMLQSKVSGNTTSFTLAPVRDADALAKRIDFARVLSVQGRVLQLLARSAGPAQAGAAQPQVAVSFQLPEGEERPLQVPPPVVWQIKPDPPPEAIKTSAKTKAPLMLPVQRVLCPTTPSMFAALGTQVGAGSRAQLFNLQTLKAGKQLLIPTGLVEPVALSPDGVYLAGKAGPAAGADANFVDVWSFNTGKRAQPLTVPEGKRATLELIDFAQPGELVLMKNDEGKRTVQVWSIDKGQMLRSWIGPASYQPRSAGLSPGRKYLAVGEKEKLWVYDLATGKAAATVDFAGTARDAWNFECHGLAFAPDGTELAGIFEGPSRSRLISWDVAKGEVVADHTFDKKLHSAYRGPALEWLPDRTALLVYGKSLFEHHTGKLIFEVAEIGTGGNHEIHVLGSDRILEVVYGVGTAMQVVELPRDKLAAAINAARSAWTALALPPARPADASQASAAAVGAPVKWSVTADPAPVNTDPIGSQPITLQQREQEVQRILFSRPESATATVLSTAGSEQLFAEKVLQAERYDLVRGQSLGSMKLCIDPQYRAGAGMASDLSSDGKTLVLVGRQDARRVDVWSLADNKHVAGWLPYASPTDTVSWVGFLDNQHVFTLSHTGKLVLWKAPEAKAVYGLERVAQGSVALSSRQKYLAVAQSGAYHIYDAARGTLVGMLAWPTLAQAAGQPSPAMGAAFSPDGTQLAAVVDGSLTCWDLKNGREWCSFTVGDGVSQLTWTGKRYVLGRGAAGQPFVYLIDLDQQLVLTAYHLPGGNPMIGSPDGRLWHLQGTPNQCSLLAQVVPDAAALKVETQLRGPSAPAILKPGMPVAVRVECGGNESIRTQIADLLQKRLQACGLTPAASAPVILTFQASIAAANDAVPPGRAGAAAAKPAPTAGQKLTCSATLGEPNAPWWRQEITANVAAAVSEPARKDEPTDPPPDKRLWQSAIAFASQMQVPSRVYLVNGRPLALPVTLSLGGAGL